MINKGAIAFMAVYVVSSGVKAICEKAVGKAIEVGVVEIMKDKGFIKG